MFRLTKKITAKLLLVFLLFTSLTTQTKANTVYVTSQETGQYHLRNGVALNQARFIPNDGNPYALCYQPEVAFEEGNKEVIHFEDYDLLTHDQRTRIQLIDYYIRLRGAATSNYWYMIGQYMVWDTVDYTFYDRVGHTMYGLFDAAEYKQRAAEINSDIANHRAIPSFHEESYTLNVGETLQLTDTNGVLNKFVMTSTNPSVTVSQSGNILTLSANAAGTTKITGRKVSEEYVGTSLVYMGAGITQNVGYTYLNDPIFTMFNVTVKEVGSLKIAKTNEAGQAIPNTAFNVSLQADMSAPLGTYTTGADGTITLENLTPGQYYVQEINVPAPYVLDESIHPVEVVLNQTTTFTHVNQAVKGRVELTKKGPSGEVVPGTLYDLRNEQGTLVETLTTGADGVARSKELPLGNYQAIETFVPAPYLLDPTPIAITLSYANQTTAVTTTQATQTNDVAKGQFSIHKTDSEISIIHLAGAEYDIFDFNQNVVGQLVTNELGQATSPVLALGTYTYKETKAPIGYQLDETIHTVVLDYADMNTPLVIVHQEVTNDVIKGQTQVVKVDSNFEEIPIEGMVFGVFDLQDNLIERITTNIDGFAFTSKLRYGDYYLQELEAPVEFYLNPNKYPFSIKEHNKIIVQYIANDRVLLRLQVNKQHGETLEPLAGVEYQVINEAGEVVTFEYLNDNNEIVTQDTLVTNSQGIAYTRGLLGYGKYRLVETKPLPGFIKSEPLEFEVTRDIEFVELNVLGATTSLTVSNFPTTTELRKVNIDKAFVEGAELQLVKVSNKEIIAHWISGQEGFIIKGLEIGETYRLEELVAPEGYLLSEPIEITIEETTDTQVFELINELIPELKTKALYDTGLKDARPSTTMTVVDEVSYSKVVPNKEYTAKGKLLDVETQEIIATGQTTFIPETREGKVEVVFNFDGSKLLGKTMVVFEDLYQGNRLVATHSELTDTEQQVRIPELRTTATDINGEKVVEALEEVTLVDTVAYTNVTPHQEITLKGWLIHKETWNVLAENELIFTPTQTSGTVEMSFTFNASELKGSHVVVFEEMRVNTTLIAEHKDINDKGQTVRIRDEQIRTTATPQPRQETNPTFVTIRDEVKYTDLVIGKEYTAKGLLMDRETKLPFLVDGQEVHSEIVFTPTQTNGSVFLDFTFDGKALKKGAVVVFEELYDGDRLVTIHADINDEGQTVHFIEILIRKVDSHDKSKVLKEAEFTLKQGDLILQVKTTDENGLARFVVEEGSYQLQETKAPAGYRLSEEVIDLTVDGTETNHLVEVTAPNMILPKKLVNTGMESTLIFTLLGITLIGMGLLFIFRTRKQTR